MNLVWLRNDLRLADNPAFTHALASGERTVVLFVINPKQHQTHGESPQKLQFIKAHVKDLRKRLAKFAIPLLIRTVPKYTDVVDVFVDLMKQLPIKTLYCHYSYWVNEKHRDEQVFNYLHKQEVKVNQYHTNYLLPPGTVTKENGDMYHVFTPYKNKYIERLKAAYEVPLGVPVINSAAHQVDVEMGSIEHQFTAKHLTQSMCDLWPIGEAEANRRLRAFTSNNDYQDERDFPAIDGTSSLSPYLAIGVISARQCLAHMLKNHGEDAFYSTWVSELIWRDFYNDLMHHHPRLAKHKTFKNDAVDHWHSDKALFENWQQGQTGFPIVDAGMRQLLKEGWMHNRVRMVVASFLSKLCLIDWRQGEAHFMAHLLDGDLASNNGGWQWSSATGCDAAPYFRIFNPTTQSKKFDSDGTYIKKYVSELRGIDSKQVHDPSPEARKSHGYTEPVIDYKSARTAALEWFKSHPVK